MIKLDKALNAWGCPEFNAVLKGEIEQLTASDLPLQQGLSHSSYVSATKFNVMIISVTDEEGLIRVRAGVFFSGVIAGCNCADDPTPMDEQAEYCEIEVLIDMATAETRVRLLVG